MKCYFLAFCGLSATLAFATAQDQEAKTEKKIEIKVNPKDVVMSAALPKQLIAGSSAELTVKLENRSKEIIAYCGRGKYWDYDLKLLDSKGGPVQGERIKTYLVAHRVT